MIPGHAMPMIGWSWSSGMLRISKMPPCLASTRNSTLSLTLVVTVAVTVTSYTPSPIGAAPIGEGVYEVTVTATVTTKVNDKVLFLVEAKQGGIFEIRNIPEDQIQPIIGIACPGIIYPYLRAIVSDVCTRAGFPPVLLSEVNFQAMFEAQQAQSNSSLSAEIPTTH